MPKSINPKFKCQMSNQIQNPNDKNLIIIVLDFGFWAWFEIWILNFGFLKKWLLDNWDLVIGHFLGQLEQLEIWLLPLYHKISSSH